MRVQLIAQPGSGPRLGDLLIEALVDRRWTLFRCSVAFAKSSGLKHLREPLRTFAQRARAQMTIGVDMAGTSAQALEALLDIFGDDTIRIFHNELAPTFHPKAYFFRNDDSAVAFLGSGNLTEGGLYVNYEAGLQIEFTLEEDEDRILAESIETALANWHAASGMTLPLNRQTLAQLCEFGYVSNEVLTPRTGTPSAIAGAFREAVPLLFRSIAVRPAPRIPGIPPAVEVQPVVEALYAEAAASDAVRNHGFAMTLQRTDVGVGQTTPGTSRRSPEIFVPLAARDAAPQFWGWRLLFREDPARPGKFDRNNVRMRIGGDVVSVNMFAWPVKHDFRLRSEALRSAGNVGDILRIEKAPDQAGFEYYVEIVPPGTSEYDTYLALCTNAVRNSPRRWGYY